MGKVSIKARRNHQGSRILKDSLKELDLKVSDILDIKIERDSIVLRKSFTHKSFEERLAGYNGEISICDFDWSEPMGRELL